MLQVYRIQMDDPEAWPEPVGEAVARIGPVPVPGGRNGTTISAALTSFPAGIDAGTVTDRSRIRRQLRSLLNNYLAKVRGYWIEWSEDPDQSGWYVPGGATFDVAGQGALQSAFWRFAGVELALLGRDRTHRRGSEIETYDRRLSTTPIDFRGLKFGPAFASMGTLRLAYLPSSITDPTVNTTTGVSLSGARQGYGSAQIQAVVDPAHLSIVSYEQGAAYRNVGDVIVYDRRGVTTAPTTGPSSSWEEVYGPDWPWTDATADTPVLENGLVRVRYDSTNTPGFDLDRWSGSAWVEVGKITLRRLGDTEGNLDTLVRADLVESSPERAVVRVIMRRAADLNSREEIFLSLQRGWLGPRIEVYPAPRAAMTAAGAAILFSSASTAGATVWRQENAVGSATTPISTETTFSASYGAGVAIGGTTWTENHGSFVPKSGEGAVHFAVLQTGLSARAFADTFAYGSARNGFAIFRNAGGDAYLSVQLAALANVTEGNLEAESLTLASGTSSTADGTASGGTAATATRTTEADHVTRASFGVGRHGKHRVLVRVRTSAGTASFRAGTGGTVRTTTSTTYVWLDLGEVTIQSGSDTLTVRAWTTTGTLYLDRVVAVPVENRLGTGPLYAGSRDLGQEALWQTIALPRIVPR